jgi:adenylyltransferase/sulfurtransferase
MSTRPISLVIHSADRYAALRRIENWQQERLLQASVLVAGAGALGNEILKNLALLGVGHIVLVDFDTVELPNLARAVLFREGDQNQSKAQTAARMVRAINPDVQVSVVSGDVEWDVGWGIFRRMDVLLGGLDNRRARVALNRHSWRARRPWVDGALTASAGAVRIFVPPESACYECTLSGKDYREMSLRYSCQGVAIHGIIEGKIPTTPTIASIVAAMQVQEALRILHDQPVMAGHEILYDADLHSLQVVRLKQRRDCLGHVTLGDLVELAEFRSTGFTARQLLERAQQDLGQEAKLELDREVVTAIVCPLGHSIRPTLMPLHRVKTDDTRCPECGGEMALTSTHTIQANSPHLDSSLAAWGLPPAHIVRARASRKIIYYELTGDIALALPWSSSQKKGNLQ